MLSTLCRTAPRQVTVRLGGSILPCTWPRSVLTTPLAVVMFILVRSSSVLTLTIVLLPSGFRFMTVPSRPIRSR